MRLLILYNSFYSLCKTVQIGEDPTDEPDFSYIPETHQIASSSSSANSLESSLMLLQESLESGAAIAQFEVRTRWLPENVCVHSECRSVVSTLFKMRIAEEW